MLPDVEATRTQVDSKNTVDGFFIVEIETDRLGNIRQCAKGKGNQYSG